jgi:DNA-binding winged helix-turn-helix (wHTH) protein/predicted ATPase
LQKIPEKRLNFLAMTLHAFGPFRLDTQDDLLFRGNEPVALGRRAIALLRALVERPGVVVSKDALITAAWARQTVEESNLTVQIAALRRALSEAPGGDRWIETMPRRGYRFVGPVMSEAQRDAVTAARPVADPLALSTIACQEAERRQITALSCELNSLKGRASVMGYLEDWREAIEGFQRCVSTTTARHNGFVLRYFGSTVLVIFGYPAAQEDDAEEAIRAGLELHVALRSLQHVTDVPMRCRVGIATGPVIVGNLIFAAAHRDLEIVGDTPELAARLQISAPPGTVIVESATRHLLGDLFECRDLDAVTNGSDIETVQRWQVLQERVVESRFEALHGSALSPLIGRDEEMGLLMRRWERAKAGNGQIVLISGEPGIGKSRLTLALEEQLQAEPHLRLRYFCSPHHQDSALYPFVSQLARASQFTRDDAPEIKLEKLKAMLAGVEPLDEDFALLADLLSLSLPDCHQLSSLSPHRKKEKTLEALIRQLECLSRQLPLVAVFEDAHWIDPTSRELLDLAIERLRSWPILLIVTFRSEFQLPWAGQPQVTTLGLSPLDRRDRMVLAEQVAGGKSLPNEVISQIVERTDGVPLFVKELTKGVLESGLLREEADRYVLDRALPPLGIPATLHASLMARLDRSASLRRIAQIGAAIGREFSYALMDTLSLLPEAELQAALDQLVASGLAFQRGVPPDAVYSFKHALVQDAAHGSMLRGTRQKLHAQIANALETCRPEIIDTQPELLALHYAEAGLIEKSVVFWGKAAQRSVLRSAMTEAATQFQMALDQLALLPDRPERQRQELLFLSGLGAALMAVKGFAAPETGRAYRRARVLWERLGSPSEFLQIPYGQSEYHINRGELDLAQCLAEDLLHLSHQRGDTPGLVLGHYASGLNLLSAGLFLRSRVHMEAGLAFYDPSAHHFLVHQAGIHPHVNSQAFLGLVLFCLGYPDQALTMSNAALAEARRLTHAPSLAASLSASGRLLSLIGDHEALEQRADELIALANEQGFPRWRALGAIYRGWAITRAGDVADGLSLLRSGSTAFRCTGDAIWTPHYTALLAGCYEIAGQILEASKLLDDALRMVSRTGERWFAAELNRQMGRLLHGQGNLDAAETSYLMALNIAREQEAKLWELRAAVSLARLRGDQGRGAEAHDMLAPIYSWFTEGFDTPDLREARATLEKLRSSPS